jgi:hypothetical protein
MSGSPRGGEKGRGVIEERQARWQIVSERLEPSESIQFDALAMWRKLGLDSERSDAEGFLVLTDRRLLFATLALGVLVDLQVSRIRNAWVTRLRAKAVHLEIETGDQNVPAFWTSKRPAWLVVGAVHGNS